MRSLATGLLEARAIAKSDNGNQTQNRRYDQKEIIDAE